MYVRRPLSMYKRDPSALSLPTPEGPNSGYLVIFDEEAQTYCCFGLCKDSRIRHLPFPQNKNLSIVDVVRDIPNTNKFMLIPVLNQPLSANRYYVIGCGDYNVGETMISSKKEDRTCAHCGQGKAVKPRPFDPFHIYQQFEAIKLQRGFYAKSITSDGSPPWFLSKKGWHVTSNTPKHYHLEEALGLNTSLRARLPDFNFPLFNDHSESVVVGKWYCPFMFVKENIEVKEQMKVSMFFEMTLEQRWEKIFSKEISKSGENSVLVDVTVQKEAARLAGRDAAWDEREVADGVLWFKSVDGVGEELSVGLSMAAVERMKWEQERVLGWGGRKERLVRIKRAQEFAGGSNGWQKFGCYVLVESFVLKRMDGSLVLSYDYKHIHQIRCRWE